MNPMKNSAFLAVLLVMAAPAGAQPMSGMSAFQYYAGSWACRGGPTSHPPVNASVTYVLERGVLRDSVSVAKQGKVDAAYFEIGATSYDSKLQRFAESSLGSDGNWDVATAKPWKGNTEIWYDRSTDDGKLGHSLVVRTDQNDYTFTGFGPTGTKPTFKAVCKRST
jgi:hypothetical protein